MSLVPADAPTFAVDGSGNLTITSNSGDSATLELSPTGINVLRAELNTLLGPIDAIYDQNFSDGNFTIARSGEHFTLSVGGVAILTMNRLAAIKCRRALAGLGAA